MLAPPQPPAFLPDILQPFWEQFLVLGKVLLALFLGGIVGLERELRDRPAGLRTHMLVAAAGCLLISLGHPMIDFFSREKGEESWLRADPIRLIEALITGVAFLGAGTIIRRHRGGVQGLTTAGSILLAAVIGVAVAIEQYVIAIGTALLTVIFLHSLHALERKIGAKHRVP